MDKIQTQPMRRIVENCEINLRHDDNTQMLSFPAASETPVDRWFGREVLSHRGGAVRLERAQQGAMPLLWNHNGDDPVGVVRGASIKQKRLIVDAELFDTERGREVATMIDSGLRNVSVGYRLHEMVLQERAEDVETYLATDWEPYEVSIVSVPADASVGIGRAPSEVITTRIISTGGHADKEERKMKDESKSAPKTAEDQTEKVTKVESGNNEALKLEEDRVKGIRNLCRANDLGNEYAEQWIRQGRSILDVIEDWGEIQAARTKSAPAAKLGLNSREVQEYSLTRAILACATKDWDKAGYELECSRAVASRTGKTPDPHTFIVPLDVLEAPRPYRRDMTAAVDAQGGFLVETSVQGFIELLRNRSVAFNMGARRLTGLQGDVAIPRQSAAATALWLTNEATQITEADQTLEQLTLTPRTVGAYTEISRQLLLQSNPSIEAIVNADLAAVVATAVDKAVLDGSGAAGQPTGISETVGIGAVSGIGFLAAAFDRVMEFQEDVAAANVMPLAGGYVTTPALASTMLQTVRFTSTDAQLWDGNLWDGTMAGFRAMSSNQVEAAEMFFGDWSEVLIGEWGILEVTTNPYANFQAGIIGVRAIYSVDVGLRHAAAFSFATAIA